MSNVQNANKIELNWIYYLFWLKTNRKGGRKKKCTAIAWIQTTHNRFASSHRVISILNHTKYYFWLNTYSCVFFWNNWQRKQKAYIFLQFEIPSDSAVGVPWIAVKDCSTKCIQNDNLFFNYSLFFLPSRTKQRLFGKWTSKT